MSPVIYFHLKTKITSNSGSSFPLINIAQHKAEGSLEQNFSNFPVHLNHLGVCQNVDSASAGPGWGLRCCISHKLPGEADAAGPWSTCRRKAKWWVLLPFSTPALPLYFNQSSSPFLQESIWNKNSSNLKQIKFLKLPGLNLHNKILKKKKKEQTIK